MSTYTLKNCLHSLSLHARKISEAKFNKSLALLSFVELFQLSSQLPKKLASDRIKLLLCLQGAMHKDSIAMNDIGIELENCGLQKEALKSYLISNYNDPAYPTAIFNISRNYYMMGAIKKALNFSRKLLDLPEKKPEFYLLSADILHDAFISNSDNNYLLESERNTLLAINHFPRETRLYLALLQILTQLKKTKEIESVIAAYTNANGDNPLILSKLAMIFLRRNELSKALSLANRIESASQQTLSNDELLETYANLSRVYIRLKKINEAKKQIQKIRKIDNNNPIISDLQINVFLNEKKLESAINLAKRHHATQQTVDSGTLLQKTLIEHKAIDELFELSFKLIKSYPKLPEPFINLAEACYIFSAPHCAIQYCKRALELSPNNPSALSNLGLLQLHIGDFFNGWKNYRFRFDTENAPKKPNINIPSVSDTCETSNINLIIISEQGLGDCIQFFRYVLFACKKYNRILFFTYPPLIPFFKTASVRNLEIMDYDRIMESLPPKTDQQWRKAYLLDLPIHLNLASPLSNINFYDHHIQKQEIKSKSSKLKIGFQWRGSKLLRSDRWRSIPLHHFGPLAKYSTHDWYSLCVDPTDDERSYLSSNNIGELLVGSKNFLESAKRISQLDLVISVDTSVAHLAATLSVKTWLLNRYGSEWRWGIPSNTTIWYDHMEIFNQTELKDWESVITRIADALRNLSLSRPEIS